MPQLGVDMGWNDRYDWVEDSECSVCGCTSTCAETEEGLVCVDCIGGVNGRGNLQRGVVA
jgi:hypothetical protein